MEAINIKAVDVAVNGSINSTTSFIAVVDNNGHVWKYAGDFNNHNAWVDITPFDNGFSRFTRLDINPSTNDIVLTDAVSCVTKIDENGGSLVYYGRPLVTSGMAGDVAVDDDGLIYSISKDITGMDAVYRNNGNSFLSWREEPQSWSSLYYDLRRCRTGMVDKRLYCCPAGFVQ